ncbi:alpha-L-fucosidase domain-containing protein [Phthorimaea operculella]|nr:alpha-L-fucosidase domain-containing protein [Phthorimaea operculella]
MKLLIILLCSTVRADLRLDAYNVIARGADDIDMKTEVINAKKRYSPEWSDLDTRPLPQWYDAAKIGIFLHWGVYSVPSFHSEWFWSYWKSGDKNITEFMKNNYPPGFTYQDFAPQFTAEFFDPKQWAELFQKAGAKYIVLTSKHHEGFTLFPSKRSFSWNSVDTGHHRDIVGQLSKAVREKGLVFGVYYSLYEWFNPIYREDKDNKCTTQVYPDTKVWPELKQLVNDYEPSVIWSDGDWENTDTYWKSKELLAWLYNDSPVKDTIVVNDRWGKGIPCHHGDFYNCDDRYNPRNLQKHKWENAFTIDKQSWGYRRNMELSEILTTNELIENIVSTVSCGGNVLINVGPTKEGTIAPIFQERLLSLGEWLKVNGDAIYGTSPWLHQNDTINGDVWYTCTKAKYNGVNPTSVPNKNDSLKAIYAIFLKWPKSNVLTLGDITPELHSGFNQVKLLGQKNDYLKWKITDGQTSIYLPNKSTVRSNHAWTLRFSPQ